MMSITKTATKEQIAEIKEYLKNHNIDIQRAKSSILILTIAYQSYSKSG